MISHEPIRNTLINFEKAFKQSMTDLYNTVIQNQNGDAKL